MQRPSGIRRRVGYVHGELEVIALSAAAIQVGHDERLASLHNHASLRSAGNGEAIKN